MPELFPSEYLIDTGGIDTFVDPPDQTITAFWRQLQKQNLQHAICEIVYWEYLRAFEAGSTSRACQHFLRAIDTESLLVLPFDRRAAELAVRLYHGVRRRLAGGKPQRRIRMNELQCDIMIAAIALNNRRTVVTDDVGDWSLLHDVVHEERLGTLPLLFKDDMRDPRRWKLR